MYYLLHGSPGRPEVFLDIASMPVRMDNLISQRRMRAEILVFPDGRIGDSTYSDSEWANTSAGDYADYVINVVHDVDPRFQTLADRRDRVIAGFSMGAYGATNVCCTTSACSPTSSPGRATTSRRGVGCSPMPAEPTWPSTARWTM